MMILTVDRAAAQEDEELGVYSLSLGGIQAGVEWLISIQLPLNISGQDISLGHDTYSITTSTGATHYCGVLGWGFWEGGFFLDLEDEAAESLDLESKVSFQVSRVGNINSKIEVGLTRILGYHL
jgi:immunity protein 10 of polymorphic toxin system